MNRTIRKVGVVMIVLVVALLGNLTYNQVVMADRYRSDPLNQRILFEEATRFRGQITGADGTILAKSVPSDDQYRYQREYPGGSAFGNLTGYYSLRYGPIGLERSQQDILVGDDPSLLGDRVQDFLTGRDPRGGNVELTILPTVQQVAYDELTAKGYTGAVVAIKPSTGEILALVSTPSFDATPFASHSEAVQKKAYNALVPARDPDPLTNRAVTNLYPPGSTFKLVVAAAALNAGLTPDTSVTSSATITLPDTGGATLSNFGRESCNGQTGDVTLTEALAHSCNTAFAEVAMNIGADAIRNQATALGMNGEETNIGLRVSPSTTGEMADQAAVAQSGIGQRDVVSTPLESAVIAATIANNGVRMTPYLVSRVTAPDLTTVSQTEPQVANQDAIKASVAEQLKTMMITTEAATPGAGQIAGLEIASKTGTAEHGTDPKNTPPHTWYVAFAPAANPTVAVAVLVENGGDAGLEATGSKVAAPIGRDVLKAAVAAQAAG